MTFGKAESENKLKYGTIHMLSYTILRYQYYMFIF